MVKRKTAGSLTQHVVITVEGDHVNIKTTTTLSKQENDFTLGTKYKTPSFGLADGEYEVHGILHVTGISSSKFLRYAALVCTILNIFDMPIP